MAETPTSSAAYDEELVVPANLDKDPLLWVVHCKRDPFDVYIGRPSKWGNPFSHKNGTLAEFKVGSRDEAVEAYREWVKTQPDLLAVLGELRGKVLGCWCAPKRCHGHILAAMANV